MTLNLNIKMLVGPEEEFSQILWFLVIIFTFDFSSITNNSFSLSLSLFPIHNKAHIHVR